MATLFEQTRNKVPWGLSKPKYEWFLVRGFMEEFFLRIGQKLHKITHNSI